MYMFPTTSGQQAHQINNYVDQKMQQLCEFLNLAEYSGAILKHMFIIANVHAVTWGAIQNY